MIATCVALEMLQFVSASSVVVCVYRWVASVVSDALVNIVTRDCYHERRVGAGELLVGPSTCAFQLP